MPLISSATDVPVELRGVVAPTPDVRLAVDNWPHIGIHWTGWDGSEWDLMDPDAGVALMPGSRGFTMPDTIDRFTTVSPALAGSRNTGHRVAEREVFLPLHVFSDASMIEWLERDRALWRTFRPDRIGTLTVTLPTGERRNLRCRYDHVDAIADLPHDGWATYGVYLVAEQPFWEGAPVARTWDNGTPVDFFADAGAVLAISKGNDASSASITNLGDVDAWPTWRLDAPITSAHVGVDGQYVEVPFAIAGSDWVDVDTHPDAQTATDSAGADRTDELGDDNYVPVPAGDSVSLDVQIVGTGRVTATITTLYYRAW